MQTLIADLDGDGILDLVSVDTAGDPDHFGGGIAVNLGIGGLAFAPTIFLGIGVSAHPTGLALGDLNGDGRLDLLVAA